MSNVWPTDKIHELLIAALQDGAAEARTESSDDARLLRYAIYNYRKRANLGLELELTIEGSSVVLRIPQAQRDFAIQRPNGD